MSAWAKRNDIDTKEWAAVREIVLARDGRECQLCGRSGRLEVDHIKPMARGGSKYGLDNLRALCRGCHISRTASQNGRRRRASPWQTFIKNRMLGRL